MQTDPVKPRFVHLLLLIQTLGHRAVAPNPRFPLKASSLSTQHPVREAFEREFRKRKTLNARCSFRAFARSLQTDVTTLSKVMKGRRPLGLQAAEKLLGRLPLSVEERMRVRGSLRAPGRLGLRDLRAQKLQAAEFRGSTFRVLAGSDMNVDLVYQEENLVRMTHSGFFGEFEPIQSEEFDPEHKTWCKLTVAL
jgi:transcriptional regulator with XRE-family HTH domain